MFDETQPAMHGSFGRWKSRVIQWNSFVVDFSLTFVRNNILMHRRVLFVLCGDFTVCMCFVYVVEVLDEFSVSVSITSEILKKLDLVKLVGWVTVLFKKYSYIVIDESVFVMIKKTRVNVCVCVWICNFMGVVSWYKCVSLWNKAQC